MERSRWTELDRAIDVLQDAGIEYRLDFERIGIFTKLGAEVGITVDEDVDLDNDNERTMYVLCYYKYGFKLLEWDEIETVTLSDLVSSIRRYMNKDKEG